MTEWAAWMVSGALLGVAGSGHCLGMCGGIAGALGMAKPSSVFGVRAPSPTLAAVLYSLGRVTSYAAMGALVGTLGSTSAQVIGGGPFMRVFAGALIVLIGLQLSGLRFGLDRLERVGLAVWRRLAPLLGWIGPADAAWKCLALGAIWGWLPCGLVYSALAASVATGSPTQSAVFMACFGLGTTPALLFATRLLGAADARLRGLQARRIAGAMLVVLGIWTASAGLMANHDQHGASDENHDHHAREAISNASPTT